MPLHFVITGPGTVGYVKADKEATLGAVRSSDRSGLSTRTESSSSEVNRCGKRTFAQINRDTS